MERRKFIQGASVIAAMTLAAQAKAQGSSSSACINIKDFGAVGNGSTDDTAAFQAAWTYAAQVTGTPGVVMKIPAGKYLISQPLVWDMSSVYGLDGNGRVSIVGDGAHCTSLVFNSALVNSTFVTLTGGDWSSGGSELRMVIGGFKLEGLSPDTSVGQTGLLLDHLIDITVSDLQIVAFTTGCSLVDAIGILFERCAFNYCSYGTYGEQNPSSGATTGSTPNEMVFLSCHWIANRQHGALFSGGSELTFVGGSFEGNGQMGSWTSEAQRYAVRFSNAGSYGVAAVIMQGVHFEGNGNVADVWIDHYLHNASYTFTGCDFTRNGAASVQAMNCIRLDTTGNTKAQLNCFGCGFDDVNGAIGTTSNRYVAYGAVTGNLHNASMVGNIYGQSGAAPVLDGTVSGTNAMASAWVDFNGNLSGPSAIAAAFNVASVTHLATGTYEIQFSRPMANSLFAISGMLATAPGFLVLNNRNASQVTVQTYNTQGALANFGEISVVVYGGGSVTE